MARTLTLIETGVQYLAKDTAIVLTTASSSALKAVNRIYRGLVLALPWGEYTQEDTSLTTTADTTRYTWPSTVVFADVKSIEILGDNTQVHDTGLGLFDTVTYQAATTDYRTVHKPPTERDWVEAGQRPSQRSPEFWKMVNVSGVMKLELRPAPTTSSQTIRITGIIEPTELTAGSSTTLFLQSSADDALEHLIASDILMHDGMAQEGAQALQKGQGILQQLFTKDQVTMELVKEVVNA